MRLGVDPRHADQMVRGSVILPNGTGKEVKILVFAKGEKEKEALDAGADYVVTQMFFDNKKYFDFVKTCRAEGIEVPIIPGLKPITSKSQENVLPSIFYIDLPEDLSDAIEKCKDNEAVRQVGIEWCVNQSRELMEFGVPSLHYYSMGKAEPVYRIAKELF